MAGEDELVKKKIIFNSKKRDTLAKILPLGTVRKIV